MLPNKGSLQFYIQDLDGKYPRSRILLRYPYPERKRFFDMFDSAVGDAILSSATTFLYIAGLVAFVTWLKRKDIVRGSTVVEKA